MKGSIIKRGKTYSIVFDAGVDINGKRKQKWESGFKTKRDAQNALNTRIFEVQHNTFFEFDKRTVGEYLSDWMKNYVEKNLAHNTIAGYKNIVNKHIIPAIGQIPLNKIQPAHIQNLYIEKMNSHLSATSVIFIHRVLHKAFKQAEKLQLINKNVCDLVEVPRKKPFEYIILNENQIKLLLESCKGSYLYIAILLAVSLGLRRGEVLGLTWSNIDFEQNVICIDRTQVSHGKENLYNSPKTKKSRRSILISDKIVDILRNHTLKQFENKETWGSKYIENDLVVCREDGSPISTCALNKAYRRLLTKCNLPPARFHDLRHTNATIMLKNKIPAKIASERLGHSSIGITLDLYSHVVNEMQKEASEIFDDNLFN